MPSSPSRVLLVIRVCCEGGSYKIKISDSCKVYRATQISIQGQTWHLNTRLKLSGHEIDLA